MTEQEVARLVRVTEEVVSEVRLLSVGFKEAKVAVAGLVSRVERLEDSQRSLTMLSDPWQLIGAGERALRDALVLLDRLRDGGLLAGALSEDEWIREGVGTCRMVCSTMSTSLRRRSAALDGWVGGSWVGGGR